MYNPDMKTKFAQNIKTVSKLKSQANLFQEKLDKLSEDQKLVLLDLIVRKIQLEISQNKSLLKDIIDGGFGLVPILGDLVQLVFSIQLIWSMKKQLQKVDIEVLLPIILLTLIDLGIGLFIGPGDIADFAITTNLFIQKYIEHLYNKAKKEAKNSGIDPDLINFITENSQQAFQMFQKQ